jgi:hypothetical protein
MQTDLDKAADAFIASMEWTPTTPQAVKDLVIDNIRGFRNYLAIKGEWKPNELSPMQLKPGRSNGQV